MNIQRHTIKRFISAKIKRFFSQKKSKEKNIFAQYQPELTQLPGSGEFGVREATTPLELRRDDYDQKFDARTIFYDCFNHDTRREVVLIGPPLRNLAKMFEGAHFHDETGKDCNFHIFPEKRTTTFFIETDSKNLTFVGSNGFTCDLSVQESGTSIFSGKRVLLTPLSKNNNLTWIYDWASYHVERYHVEAVLLYDNNSTEYSIGDIEKTLQKVPGLEVGIVVDWSVPYGISVKSCDADFAQQSALEHAHRNFLAQARSVFSADIDEILISESQVNPFEIIERSIYGYLEFQGDWVYCCNTKLDIDTVKHKDHVYKKNPDTRCAKKWIVAPRSQAEGSIWLIHGIRHLIPDKIKGVSFAHFRNISKSWNWDRSIRQREPFTTFEVDKNFNETKRILEKINNQEKRPL